MPEPLQHLRARLRAVGFGPALAFGGLAIVADELEHLPGDLRTLALQGRSGALMHERLQHMAGELVLVLVVLLALVAVARTRAELLARPARSLALLLGAASLGLLAMSAAEAAWARPGVLDRGLAALPWWPMLEAWAALLMWGVLWGWLFLQHLRQRDADQRLALMLGRRAALSRQMLEAQLGRARAQMDPATIVQVLRAARERAEACPAAASGAAAAIPLIDHLAGYLRLLLQRVRASAPTLASDVELLRALVALHRAHRRPSIELVIDASVVARADRPAGAAFLVARQLLDGALLDAAGSHLRLSLTASDAALRIEAAWSAVAQGGGAPSIAATLQQLQPGLRFEDKHHDTGRRWIAHVPLP
jgi:hypothetical protein